VGGLVWAGLGVSRIVDGDGRAVGLKGSDDPAPTVLVIAGTVVPEPRARDPAQAKPGAENEHQYGEHTR